jgi:hypothetical protein
MYRSYLSFSPLKEYLKLLEQRRLVTVGSAAKLYSLTEKEPQFMNACDRIMELVPDADRMAPIQKAADQARDVFNY